MKKKRYVIQVRFFPRSKLFFNIFCPHMTKSQHSVVPTTISLVVSPANTTQQVGLRAGIHSSAGSRSGISSLSPQMRPKSRPLGVTSSTCLPTSSWIVHSMINFGERMIRKYHFQLLFQHNHHRQSSVWV